MRQASVAGSVYVVDDDYDVRNSLALLLRSVGIEARGFDTAEALLAALGPASAGCVVTDVRMPGMSGLQLQQELARRGLALPLIMITGHADVPMAVAAMKAGALDFLQKPFGDQDLIDRVQAALRMDAARRERRGAEVAMHERLAALTPRESEVMERVIAGKPNKIIARELGLSTRTVEIHRARVMEKMGASSLAELVRMMAAR
ncbi:MAG TPA: response regulator [Burkholderiales bacterium]|nr:response regulator [Burkholderiales bacterium]